jgi:SEC-C motif domain protein
MMHCLCGTKKLYQECCGPLLAGLAIAKTPEALMRSRYTAFAEGKMDYIRRTMKGPAAERFNADDDEHTIVKWLGLEVIRSIIQGDRGLVEFKAYYNRNERTHVLHECSEFHCNEGIWFYVDGTDPDLIAPNPRNIAGRNSVCPCRSGKKYKKCCGK